MAAVIKQIQLHGDNLEEFTAGLDIIEEQRKYSTLMSIVSSIHVLLSKFVEKFTLYQGLRLELNNSPFGLVGWLDTI